RSIEPGEHPELESGLLLARRGFERIPPLLGALEYRQAASPTPSTAALLFGWITNQGTGWQFSIDDLRRYYERTSARTPRSDDASVASPGEGQPPPFFAALESLYLANAATLGRRTAELHLALADESDPAFAPEKMDENALQQLSGDLTVHASLVLDVLQSC